MSNSRFSIQGHRGARGVRAENTIAGMIKAIQDGANGLEMDIQFTADGKVIVAHDPFLNATYTLDQYGNEMDRNEGRKHVFYRMDYVNVRSYDVGSKGNLKFPKQQKIKAHIPELAELIDAVESYCSINNIESVFYNIEIKASPAGDDKLHPQPLALIERVVSILKAARIEGRYYLQSFDPRQLQVLNQSFPEIAVAILTADKHKNISEHLLPVGFLPDIFSPYYKIITADMVNKAHDLGIKIIPWTVNQPKIMESLLNMGVDGIITDYPGILYKLVND